MNSRILSIISNVLTTPETLISDIEIVSPEEQKYLVDTINDTYMDYDKTTNIVKEFEKQVINNPKKIALVCENQTLTYEELNNKANWVAHSLKNIQVNNKDIVAIMLKRSTDMIVAIMGILKAGATYMPIDPEYPEDRKEFMLANSKAKAFIDRNFMDKFVYDEYKNLEIDIPSDSLSYIMYTSGSTGKPKAVCIKHHNVINFTKSMAKRLDYKPSDANIIMSVTTMCFDIFVFELFPTLLNGLTLVIATEIEARSPELLNKIILENKISKILTTPSRIQLLFLDNKYTECLKHLKEIILGGEPFPHSLLKDLQKITTTKIYNLYGPTETTVYSAFKELTNEDEITIGEAIENTDIYILNENNKIMPTGVIGEICIAGEGVGSGYYKNEELTNSVFINNPYRESGLLYKTGDLGYINSNNEFICLGRKDYQIKLRGFRIELGDIESNILSYPNIDKAIVIDRDNENNQKYLCAYIVSQEEIVINDLQKYLTTKLPNYMVPTYIMQIEKIPLTFNHKVDRKALPLPNVEERHVEKEYVAPTNNVQEILCKIIASELGLERIGITTDIFEYNIDSLGIIKIQTKLIPYQYKIITQDFYTYRTIEKIADKIINTEEETTETEANVELTNINNTFIKHSDNNIIKQSNSFKNILLVGVTGYLGIHMLKELLDTTAAYIICPIREKNGVSQKQRLVDLYKYYFNSDIDFSRVTVINANILHDNIGLDENIAKTIDLAINAVANVKYYGDYEEFKKTNVLVVSNLIDFCITHNIKLAHISTLGVSGNYLVGHKNELNIFTENSFYIGQNYKENVYIQTKFEAEELIYKKVKEGLDVVILRVGNLTGRYSDGLFQKNIEENAFYNLLRVIISCGIIPEKMSQQFLEFTPVDLCASAVIKILLNFDNSYRVFHMLNTTFLQVPKMLEFLEQIGKPVRILDGTTFNSEVSNIMKTNSSNKLKGIINDMDMENGLSFNASVIQKNEYTTKYLAEVDFCWPIIDVEYIEKIVKHMEDRNYI